MTPDNIENKDKKLIFISGIAKTNFPLAVVLFSMLTNAAKANLMDLYGDAGASLFISKLDLKKAFNTLVTLSKENGTPKRGIKRVAGILGALNKSGKSIISDETTLQVLLGMIKNNLRKETIAIYNLLPKEKKTFLKPKLEASVK